jgi:DNA modification methylase
MTISILCGDCRDLLRQLPDASVHCVVTSPPYWGLRNYGIAGQFGLEASLGEYVDVMVGVFREVRRVLRKDGTLWLNLGDSYAGGGNAGGGSYDAERNWRRGNPEMNGGQSNRDGLGRISNLKPKDLCGIPWRIAFALQADGWYLRQDIIWSKPNPMPESIRDRCTKAHEYLFLMAKSERYYYDAEAIAEELAESTLRIHSSSGVNPRGSGADWKQYNVGNGHSGLVNGNLRDGKRNKRSVWEVTTQPFSEAHFATFPPALIEPCIKAGCPKDSTVLDPFAGAGTTGLVADRLQRNAILIELKPEYAAMAERRLVADAPLFVNIALVAVSRETATSGGQAPASARAGISRAVR